MNKTEQAFGRLYEIIGKLRAPDGCPWDREQTPETMRENLVEEAFEAVDAINAHDTPHVREELGDVILNAGMIAYMYEQKGDFSLANVLNEISDKVVRRHPHVWPESEGQKAALKGGAKTADDVLTQWDAIKQGVEGRAGSKSILDEVSGGLPPLMRACKLQKKAAKKGFDWTDVAPVKNKVLEELEEVQEAATKDAAAGLEKASAETEGEIGDLLFAVVNLARHLKVDPTLAMERANEKFYRRFSYVEKKMAEAGLEMSHDAMKEMDSFWDEAKSCE